MFCVPRSRDPADGLGAQAAARALRRGPRQGLALGQGRRRQRQAGQVGATPGTALGHPQLVLSVRPLLTPPLPDTLGGSGRFTSCVPTRLERRLLQILRLQTGCSSETRSDGTSPAVFTKNGGFSHSSLKYHQYLRVWVPALGTVRADALSLVGSSKFPLSIKALKLKAGPTSVSL